MPTHDAMHTAMMAEQLNGLVKNDLKLRRKLKKVEREATEASTAGALAALAMFDALELAMESDDPKVAALAKKMYYGWFNTIIA